MPMLCIYRRSMEYGADWEPCIKWGARITLGQWQFLPTVKYRNIRRGLKIIRRRVLAEDFMSMFYVLFVCCAASA